jgi:uncharacterized membrane protein
MSRLAARAFQQVQALTCTGNTFTATSHVKGLVFGLNMVNTPVYLSVVVVIIIISVFLTFQLQTCPMNENGKPPN